MSFLNCLKCANQFTDLITKHKKYKHDKYKVLCAILSKGIMCISSPYRTSIKNFLMRHWKRILFQTLQCGNTIA